MSTPLTIDDLKRFRSIVETGTPLDKRTVLNIISHAGQLQEHLDMAHDANGALVKHLAELGADAVNNVEILPAKIRLISWEGQHELDVDLESDETLIVLTVKTDRGWSLGDKAELKLTRPEVSDA